MMWTPSTRSVSASARIFTKPSVCEVRLRAAVGHEGELAGLVVAARRLQLLLGLADPGDLGGGVDHARDHPVVHVAGLAGDELGDGDALVLGLVGQHRAGDASPMPRRRRRWCGSGVDLDLAALVEPRRLLQAEPGGVGPPADRDQHVSASRVASLPPLRRL